MTAPVQGDSVQQNLRFNAEGVPLEEGPGDDVPLGVKPPLWNRNGSVHVCPQAVEECDENVDAQTTAEVSGCKYIIGR